MAKQNQEFEELITNLESKQSEVEHILQKNAELPYPLSPSLLTANLLRILEKMVTDLEKCPVDLINAILKALQEAPIESKYELIPEIVKKVNSELQLINKQLPTYSGKQVGSVLTLLGFSDRGKGDRGNKVFVDRDLLKHYAKSRCTWLGCNTVNGTST